MIVNFTEHSMDVLSENLTPTSGYHLYTLISRGFDKREEIDMGYFDISKPLTVSHTGC